MANRSAAVPDALDSITRARRQDYLAPASKPEIRLVLWMSCGPWEGLLFFVWPSQNEPKLRCADLNLNPVSRGGNAQGRHVPLQPRAKLMKLFNRDEMKESGQRFRPKWDPTEGLSL